MSPKTMGRFNSDAVAGMFEYLDELRESGVTNMFGAGAYLQRDLDVSRDEASAILAEWMRTFSERHPPTSTSPRGGTP